VETPSASRAAYLQLHLLVVIFASTAVIGQYISFSAPAIVIWRTLFAAIGGAFLVGVVLRCPLLPPVAIVWRLLGIGAIVGCHWMCFFGAIRLANISICLAGMATMSFFTAFTEPWIEKRRVRPFEVLLGLIALSGILLVAGFERGRIAGLAVALMGAFLAAVFPVLNRAVVRGSGVHPLTMVVWEMAGACLVCLAALPLLDGPAGYAALFRWQALDWLWILLLALVCTVFSHAWHIRLLRHISAYSANLAGNLEPVYGILAAALIFHEHRDLHPGFFAGTAAILSANILHPLLIHWQRRKRMQE
jgi:drug/metabolite transporter (DMT)-like permease